MYNTTRPVALHTQAAHPAGDRFRLMTGPEAHKRLGDGAIVGDRGRLLAPRLEPFDRLSQLDEDPRLR